MMWLFIFGGFLLAAFIGILYLISRFARFTIVKKAAGGKKAVSLVMGFVLVMVLVLAAGGTLGAINAGICMIHLTVIWLLCDAASGIIKRKYKRTFTYYYAGVFAIGITTVYLACGWYLAHHVWRTEYTAETGKQAGDLCIVQFADSHVGTTFDGAGFAEHVKAMQAEEPDIVVVTGDFVDDDTTKEDMIAACAALGTLRTKYGVYYVFGNHDKGYYDPARRGYGEAELTAELEKNNVVILEDETVLLDGRIYLIGRQDLSETEKGNIRASMEELTAGLDQEKYMIVLDHQPGDYEAQEAAGVDLVLSGHTHGGQMFPVRKAGEWMGVNDMTYGMERRGNTDFIVTSGISDWAVRFKTGCKSEYVVLRVCGQEAADQ